MNFGTNLRKQLTRTIAAGLAVAGLGVAADTMPASAAAPKCSSTTDCIGAYTITQELPVDLAIPTFKFNTTVPTKATMKIQRNGTTVATKTETTFGTSHSWWYLNGLQQGTSYTFYVTVVAQDGSTRGESKNFVTMQRKVVVTIDRITIQNDSDPIGSGELRAFGQAASQFIVGTAQMSKGDGSTITIGKSVTIYKAKSSVKVEVAVRDNDCTGICYDSPSAEWKVIDNTDWEQGYGYTTLTGLQLPGWAVDVPFSFKSSGPVKFTVYGHYSLSAG